VGVVQLPQDGKLLLNLQARTASTGTETAGHSSTTSSDQAQ
jgi:hypothetical protein